MPSNSLPAVREVHIVEEIFFSREGTIRVGIDDRDRAINAE